MKLRAVQWAIAWSVLTASLACNVAPSSPPRPAASITLAPLVAPDAAIAAHVEESVRYLASDELEGRDVGTRGIHLAAEYIAEQFERIGLEPPPGQNDYFQRFHVTLGKTMAADTQLRVGNTSLEAGKDFIPLSLSAERTFSGNVAFVGYGISSTEHEYDDYAALDNLDGLVALALRYEPHNRRGGSRFARSGHSSAAALHEKAKTAAERGASALLIVSPPNFHEKEQDLISLDRQYPGGTASLPVMHISREVAQRILGEELDLASLQKQIDTTGKPHSRGLEGPRVSGEVQLEQNKTEAKNVWAFLPGTGPGRHEVIVVGAHYDHLGRGGRGSLARGSNQIHNGADDNASGTAALLAMAQLMAQSGPRARSILFVAFTGEERGLLGSHQFVENPPMPLDRIVAMVNLDMVGRVRNNTLYISGDGTAKAFGEILQGLDLDSPLELQSIGKGGLGPSDHMSFAVRKIPVLMFFSGLHLDYHRPTDTAEKINYDAMMHVIELATRFVDEVAMLPRQEYVAAHDSRSMQPHSTRQTQVTLGVVPDYTSGDSTDGVRISGVVPGSPAEAAGLQGGDVIVAAEPMKIQTLSDLSAVLARGKPGDTLRLKVRREGREIELTATLAARKG